MSSEPIVVDTNLGKLRGLVQKSIVGDDYFSFKGIPYAKPPTGQLRFQDPQPIEAWSGVRDATKHGSICAQCDFITKAISGSDDCLYLNVYTKNLKPDKNIPVMVWIHGGGFVGGEGDEKWYGPDYFLRKDVVLVTINYRLGVLGFLNLEDEVAPGNQGLKDQVLALEWVRDNIASFGGDPRNVTIFGESAGSASVHYLCVSPLAQGLFDKAICQSGVALNPWARVFDPKKFAYKMCKMLGNDTRDHGKIVEFLRTIDALKLIEIQEQLLSKEEKIQLVFPFGPNTDTKSKNPFMPVDIEETVKKGVQVPLLIGYTNREGMIFLEITGAQKKEILATPKPEFEKFLHPNFKNEIKKYKLTPDDFRRLYFNNDDLAEENFETFIDLLGDVFFVDGIHKVVEIQLEQSCSPTYLYQFSFDKVLSPAKQFMKTNMKGASHGDELAYQFRMQFMDSLQGPLQRNTESYRLMEQMIELWVNFATFGRPTPTLTDLVPFYWPPVTNKTALRFLNINEDLRMATTLNYKHRLTAHDFRNSVD